jgi:hypothetical protein
MIKKGIITSLMGILVLIGLGFNIYTNGGLSVQDIILLLTALGLLAAKDVNASHTKDKIADNPPPDDDDDDETPG